MMKKMIAGTIAMIITTIICIGIVEELNTPKSDVEIMDDYVMKRYGEEYYGVLYDDYDEGTIDFMVYDMTGEDCYSVSIDKEFYMD